MSGASLPAAGPFSRLFINNVARTDGVDDLGKVADVRSRIAVEDDEVGIKSLLDAPLLGGFEIQSRIDGERCNHFHFGKRAMHELEFEGSVVDFDEPNVGAKKNRAAVRRKRFEVGDA